MTTGVAAITLRKPPAVTGMLALCLLATVCSIRYRSQGFISAATAVNLLGDNAVLGIVAVGMTLVIVSGGIDLAAGAVMSASSVLCALLIMTAACNAWSAIALTVVLGTTYGAATGLVIHATRLPAFIVTLSGLFLIRGLGYLLHLESVSIEDQVHSAIASFRLPIWPSVSLPTTAVALIAFVALGQAVLSLTRLGMRIRAVGGDESAARLQGVPVLRTRMMTYAFSGLCASAAGVTLTLYLSSGSHLEGVGMELDAITAVVIGGAALTGGNGSVLGTLVGVLTVGLVLTAMTYEGTLNSGLTRVAIGGMLLVFAVLQRTMSRIGTRPHIRP